jgi:hypothetical protein
MSRNPAGSVRKPDQASALKHSQLQAKQTQIGRTPLPDKWDIDAPLGPPGYLPKNRYYKPHSAASVIKKTVNFR